ncbi:MAG: nuclear transport factor 2 family protein [Pseudorhodoplanes sp.]
MAYHPHVGLILQLYAAFGRGDFAALLDSLTEDVDWQTVGTGDYPVFGARRGKAQVAQFLEDVAANEDFSEFTPREFYAVEDKVFVCGSYRGTLKKTGRPFGGEWVHVFTLREGKICRFREHTDTAQFVDGHRA